MALLEPGDKVMGMRLDQGGHLTHGSPVNFSGRMYDFVAYGVDDDTEMLDYDVIRDLAVRERPRMIIAGATAYPRIIDFEAFRAIADEVGALLLVDAAHIAGLVAGGAHPSPVPYADVVTFTTHKTLRGPRAGAILCRRRVRGRDRQGGVPGLAGRSAHARDRGEGGRVPRGEPARRSASTRPTSSRTRRRSPTALAEEGFRIVSGGTDNHLMLVDLRPFGVTGKVAQEALDRAGITCNKNAIPNDPEKPFVTSGLRLGAASCTTAGMGPDEMREIAVADRAACCAPSTTTAVAADVREQANRLCSKFTPYPEGA